jgi:hypothetical protein
MLLCCRGGYWLELSDGAARWTKTARDKGQTGDEAAESHSGVLYLLIAVVAEQTKFQTVSQKAWDGWLKYLGGSRANRGRLGMEPGLSRKGDL